MGLRLQVQVWLGQALLLWNLIGMLLYLFDPDAVCFPGSPEGAVSQMKG